MDQSATDSPSEWILDVVARWEGDLVRYARHLVGDAERARDVVQDTFLKLCQQDRGQLDGHLVEWLFTVCRNGALDVRRKEQRMTTMTLDAVQDSAGFDPQPEDVAEQRDETIYVLRLMTDLPANQQEVLRLKFQHSLSYREISSITGLSETNVGFLIHVGIKRLRERLSEFGAR
ncbi:MAG: sigma-70 family RNA polymerase sigma factor [Planctomycetaceae bacterium]|nr:sigma-70 family RNA polymerase sigma factor [Planctomycetaceae bacterium]